MVKQRPQAEATLTEGARRRLGPGDEGRRAPTRPACVEVAATDPLYVLYTSGTTGKPKGIVRDNGGHAVAMAWSLPNIYDVHAGQVWWAASDVGWVVGHSYIVYAPLISGATTVLYEGKPVGTPDAGAFWRVIAEHGVEALFTAPTAIRAIKKEDPDGALLGRPRHSARCARCSWPGSGSTPTPTTGPPSGSACRSSTTGGRPRPAGRSRRTCAASSRCRSSRARRPCRCRATTSQVLDPTGQPVAAGRGGGDLPQAAAAARARCRRCGATTSGSSRRTSSAFDGYYLSGDGGYVDEDGYLFVMGRTDDVINVAGHRLSTGSMEAVLAAHPAVAECAVIGVADPLKGQVPRGFVVLKAGVDRRPRRRSAGELVAMVRDEIGAGRGVQGRRRSSPALPKTRSGKILRKTMREIADGKDAAVPSTIEDAGGARPACVRRSAATDALPARRSLSVPPSSGAIAAAIRLGRPVSRSSVSASPIARSPALTPSQRSGSGSQRRDRCCTQGSAVSSVSRPRTRSRRVRPARFVVLDAVADVAAGPGEPGARGRARPTRTSRGGCRAGRPRRG